MFAAVSTGNNTLKIVSSTISGNTGTPSTGGSGSTNGNAGTVVGGGVEAESGNLTLINSTVSGNVSSGDSEGGGIDMRSTTGTLTLGNDTIFGNTRRCREATSAAPRHRSRSPARSSPAASRVPAHSTTGNCSLDTVTVIDLGHNLEEHGADAVRSVGPGHTSSASTPRSRPSQATAVSPRRWRSAPRSPALGAGGACTDISMAGSVTLSVDQRGLPRARRATSAPFSTSRSPSGRGPRSPGARRSPASSPAPRAAGAATGCRSSISGHAAAARSPVPRGMRCSCPRLTSGRSSAVRSRPTAPTAPGRRARR